MHGHMNVKLETRGKYEAQLCSKNEMPLYITET